MYKPLKRSLIFEKLEKGNYTDFPQLCKQSSNDPFIYLHFIRDLQVDFTNRFADIRSKEDNLKLFTQPLSTDADTVSTECQMELIELQTKSYLSSKHDSRDSSFEFYVKYLNDLTNFPNLINHAKKMKCIFVSTYMCVSSCSLKRKMRNKMTDENLNERLRLTSTKINVVIEKLTRDAQHQKSY